ncbi:myosin-G heavy chain [Toxorhynchites rutilus septentrionalis]|uniref:myosin-G heavy chain n=1 Tax=Toxorhynchites rutilus septentrionalis TaxID=329112 RepID=UPI002479C34D|nr:myosin-G heavy chain [Toxorhynchites rutilus septentrionalis]XP_055624769.1 myosin-G heavy chain [Toxorhynchites rutilus septentrionalis]
MAKDNNNINIADELTSGNGTSGSPASSLKHNSRLSNDLQHMDANGVGTNGVPGASTDAGSDLHHSALGSSRQNASNTAAGSVDSDSVTAVPDLPRREENPFSFKHFLKRDSSLGTGSASCSSTSASVSNNANINHSRSTSNINGNNCGGSSGSCTNTSHFLNNNNNNNNNNSSNSSNNNVVTSSASPSKSATTSSLHNSSMTGAKPKIPQFQSVNTLSSESKMKRSPRFPSFDSQSSLSDLADDKFMANIYHSRSNNSFNLDYPPSGSGSIPGGSQYVQRSYSNYDMESPGSADSPRLLGSQNLHNSPNLARRSRENLSSAHRMGNSEYPAALPDFVQDHLVLEQWYTTITSPKSVSPVSVEFDQLPDFAVNNLEPESGGRGHGPIINDIPFDLTYNSASMAGSSSGGLGSANRNRTPLRNTSPNVPLDLPPQNFEFSFDLPRRRTTPPQAVPELPPDLTENNATAAARSGFFFSDVDRHHSPPPTGSAADKIHRLPDFLSDGPIHSSGRLADVTHDTPHFNSPDADTNLLHQQRLQIERQENERLRRELDDNRRVIAEQTRHLKELQKSLDMAKSSTTHAVHHTVEGIEENLDKSYLRAATAESQVLKLRQKIKRMHVEIETLRQENEALKEEGAVGGASVSEGACGGPSVGASSSRPFGARHNHHRSMSRAQELSRELRQAAATAENNLRQLLTGVDNLRLMASTIENIEPIDVANPDDFLSDSDNDLLGPAL